MISARHAADILSQSHEVPVRDADLVAKLEAARGSIGFNIVCRSYEREQAERDRLAALPPGKRRRQLVAQQIDATPPKPDDLRHVHSVLAICSLPYERLPEVTPHFSRRQGNMAIHVTAGILPSNTGKDSPQPIPFGPKARLIMMHLCSEAIRQKSPTIDIADTFTGFVRDMGFTDSGGRRGPLTAFKEQLNALSACTMRLTTWNNQIMRSKAFVPIDDINLWMSNEPGQRSLWPSTVTFSEPMFKSLSRHALPLNKHVLKALAASSRKLDIYAWLSWRMHNLDKPLVLSWDRLHEQFGASNANRDRFKQLFAQDFADVVEILARLPAKLSENGSTVLPADPGALALPAKTTLAKTA